MTPRIGRGVFSVLTVINREALIVPNANSAAEASTSTIQPPENIEAPVMNWFGQAAAVEGWQLKLPCPPKDGLAVARCLGFGASRAAGYGSTNEQEENGS